MKVLRPELAADPEARDRFRLEPRLMNAARHAGVPRAVAEGLTPDDLPYFTMDWIDGETLADRAARLGGRLSAREVDRIGLQLATRAKAIHEAGVLHLDLKPDNLFATRAGTLMVSDFGISRWMAEASDPPAPLGTPLFMAPEQVTGANLGPWTDVRALGATLFVLLTGRAPSPTRAHRSTLGLLLAPPRPVRSICPSAPPHLADLIDRCLSPIPARRPTTDEIRTTLGAALSSRDAW